MSADVFLFIIYCSKLTIIKSTAVVFVVVSKLNKKNIKLNPMSYDDKSKPRNSLRSQK